jgi:hypothetical protein
VSGPDFELHGHLRARQVRVIAPPSAEIEADGGVELDKRRTRRNVPRQMEAGATYSGVRVKRELRGRLRDAGVRGDPTGPDQRPE